MGKSLAAVLVGLATVLASAAALGGTPGQTSVEEVGAKTWIGRAGEIEAFIDQAEVVRIEDIGVGVTKPKRVELAPGGPVDRIAWKPIRPGIYRGFYESYKAEIAAYELDKLLGLHMIPVTVEKRIRGDLGAACLWVSPTQSFKELGGVPTPPSSRAVLWNIQIIRAKMFDNLIYNRDPNLGNWLVDPAWNLILIDHSRAFTPDTKLVHEMGRVDRQLWDRMRALDEPTLGRGLGAWLNPKEIRAILERRALMERVIAEMVAARGEADVFVRYEEPRAGEAIHEDHTLARRLLAALARPPIVLPSSPLGWLGEVVELASYRGSHEAVRQAGLRQGHAYGLLTASDGLLWLAPDAQDSAHCDALNTLAGHQAEIIGTMTRLDEAIVVHVTACRRAP